MSNLELIVVEAISPQSRINVDAMRVALAIPEAMTASDQLVKTLEAFCNEALIGQTAYESMIDSIELTARILQSSAETLRNGVKPKVCGSCRK
jgi:hypothetical protein